MGWLKCNFDGVWDEVGELRGIGIMIRNERGEFVAATAMKTRGVCSVLLAETMVARVAVVFAYSLAATHLEMQGDAMVVMNAPSKEYGNNM